jgi:hypothetical protein
VVEGRFWFAKQFVVTVRYDNIGEHVWKEEAGWAFSTAEEAWAMGRKWVRETHAMYSDPDDEKGYN